MNFAEGHSTIPLLVPCVHWTLGVSACSSLLRLPEASVNKNSLESEVPVRQRAPVLELV